MTSSANDSSILWRKVFDCFHIMKLFNDKLSDLRRELYREAAAGPAKNVLKGIRWLLLRNQENLDDEKNEWERFQEALELNHSLVSWSSDFRVNLFVAKVVGIR